MSALKNLGARHHKYNINQDHYPVVRQALVETLVAALGDDFTKEVKEE
jgi:hemoglobin-like flavoprotein